jgi:ribulose-phosphate 3-epimerase
MNSSSLLTSLRQKLPIVAPSMLKCDFGNLARDVQLLERGGATALHWDVMDGNFVPNLTYGAMVIQRLRERTRLLFEAHLMITEPMRYVEEYIRAGCQWITVHYEAGAEIGAVLGRIREAGCLAGLAINPKTPASAVQSLADRWDSVLVMSVEPGFGGQSFLPGSIEKLKEVRAMARPDQIVSIDGGIGPDTIAACAAAGADTFVVGSAIFDRPDYRLALDELTSLASRSHRGPQGSS